MSISHRTSRLRLVSSPSVEKLQNSRFRLTFNLQSTNPREDWYNDNKGRIFADYGSLQNAEFSTDGASARSGETYSDMRLVQATSQQQGNEYLVTFVYETLSSSFVQTKDDTISIEPNGLRSVTRESIAAAGTAYSKTIGSASDAISHQINSETAQTLQLASFEIDDTDAFRKVTEKFVATGLISETVEQGPREFGNVKQVTHVSYGTATTLGSTPAGVLIASKEESKNGFITFTKTALQNASDGGTTVTGITQEYKDVAEVDVVGTVNCTEKTVIFGTISVVEVVPPRQKQVPVNIKVEMTTSPPGTFVPAYDLGQVSCSVTFIQSSSRNSAGNTVKFVSPSGNHTRTRTGFNQSISNTARVQNYNGCHLLTTESSGRVDYTSFESPRLVDNGIVSDFGNASETSSCIGSGATSSAGYNETGIISQDSRLILTALDGTKYYEVTTVTVA